MKTFVSVLMIVLLHLTGAAPADAEKVCESKEFIDKCKKASSYYRQHCANPRSLDPYRIDSDANDAWMEEVEKIPEVVAYWKKVADQYPSCYSGWAECRLSEHERDACLDLGKTYKESFAEFVGVIKGDILTSWKRDIAKAHKNPLDPFATQVFGTARKVIDGLRKVAKLDFLEANLAEIDELERWLKKEETQWLAERDKTLAKVKCPTPKYRNKKLTRKLRQVLLAHGEATKKPDSTLEETVGQFGLSGKPERKREPLARVTHEDIPAFACVLQERDERRTCRIFQITFRRSKPDGSRWGDWAFYSIGGGGELSCKNVKIK